MKVGKKRAEFPAMFVREKGVFQTPGGKMSVDGGGRGAGGAAVLLL
jgi:hypothetical protein